MKALRGLLIFLIFTIVVITLLSLLLPSKVTIVKSVDINASSEKITSQITDFEQWKNWYPAFKDEQITVLKDTPDNNSVTLKDQNGKQVILRLKEVKPELVNIELRTNSSSKVSYHFFLTPKVNHQTQLTWGITTELKWYPWEKIRGLFLDKVSGNQYEQALNNLKKAAED